MNSKITFRDLTAADLRLTLTFDDSFVVDSVLVLTLADGKIGYSVEGVPRYRKRYSDEQDDGEELSAYIGSPDRIACFAFDGDRAVGRILLRRNWNRYAYVEDLAVDADYRGRGIGRGLIDRAKRWAEAGGMPGIMLETQSNNASACRFYERCGFEIGGFDTRLYRGVKPHRDEVAVFWYWNLPAGSADRRP